MQPLILSEQVTQGVARFSASGVSELEAENARIGKMYVEERIKAEVVAEALAKKW